MLKKKTCPLHKNQLKVKLTQRIQEVVNLMNLLSGIPAVFLCAVCT